MLAKPAVELAAEGGAGYARLTVRRFFATSFTEPDSVYPALLRDAFRRIDETGATRLIVDLRDNEGGIGANAAHLLGYLSDSSVTPTKQLWLRGNDGYYAAIVLHEMKLNERLGLRAAQDGYTVTRTDAFNLRELQSFAPASRYGFRGTLIVLVNGGTISAAGMAAGLLQEYTAAVFVGQEAGGFAGMSNGVQRLTVPGKGTDTSISIPLLHAEFAVSPYRRGRGVVPDHTVTDTVADLVAGRDAALAFAIGLATGEKRASPPEPLDAAIIPVAPVLVLKNQGDES